MNLQVAGPSFRPSLLPQHSTAQRPTLRQGLRTARRWRRCVAASKPDGFETFARDASKKVNQFVEEQQLKQKAEKAGKATLESMQSTLESVSDSAQRTYIRLDSEYGLADKAGRTAKKLEEQLKDVDQTYGVRQKLRVLKEDVQRAAPGWQKQLGEFGQTVPGRLLFFLLIYVAFTTGLVWRAINVAWLLWCISLPVTFILGAEERKRQMQEQGGAAAAPQQQQAGQANPFAGFPGFGAKPASTKFDNTGPIIDADFRTLDEDD